MLGVMAVGLVVEIVAPGVATVGVSMVISAKVVDAGVVVGVSV